MSDTVQTQRYAIQRSNEPSDAEIETVARAINRASYTSGATHIPPIIYEAARAAICAIRGLDAGATP